MAQNKNLAALSAAGVSVWLDDLSRERLQTGNLQELIDTKSIVGVTTNPSIFQAALSKGDAYDAQIKELAERGADVDATIRTVTTDDVRNACDVFAKIYEQSGGVERLHLAVADRPQRDHRHVQRVEPRVARDGHVPRGGRNDQHERECDDGRETPGEERGRVRSAIEQPRRVPGPPTCSRSHASSLPPVG